MLIKELINKKILVWGYGIEGKSAIDLLLKNNCKHSIYVATLEKINEEINNIVFITENEIFNYNFDIIIKSSGISSYKNEIIELRKKGIIITTIINIFLAEVNNYKKTTKNKFPKIIAITGTKGKSTTCSICEFMLNNLGYKAILVGNIGISVLDLIDNFYKYDYLIIELSSQQCCEIKFMVDYGIVLNLFPEHIDWHLNHNNYYNDKMKLLNFSKKSIVNYNNNEILNRLVDNKEYLFFNAVSGFYVKNQNIYDIYKEICNIKNFININGEHIFQNICSILTFLKEESIDFEKALEILHNFKTLEHRLEVFYYNNTTNTKYINDSISTIPEATIQAIKTFNKTDIYLILGGFDREQNYEKLIEYIQSETKIKKIFLLGTTGKKILELLKNSKMIHNYYSSLEELVENLKKDNLTNINVVFSPASASFDNFKNFKERGEKFKELMLQK